VRRVEASIGDGSVFGGELELRLEFVRVESFGEDGSGDMSDPESIGGCSKGQRSFRLFCERDNYNNQHNNMRWLFSFLLLWLSATVSALSASGDRVLVVLEEAGEKDKYSTFWGDLEGMFSPSLMN
jgi:hypothetical protein